MPRNRDYIDKEARVGRAKLAPRSEMLISARSVSRSLDSLTPNENKKLNIESRSDGYYYISTSLIVSDRIKITKKNMKKLAKWILSLEAKSLER